MLEKIMFEQKNAVNFNYILKTGQIPVYTNNPLATLSTPNQTINWNSRDAFTRALDTIQQKTAADIQNNPDMQKLLQKNNWNKQDREKWEEQVGNIVAKETGKIPGLSGYRDETTAKRATSLNDLGVDIEHNGKSRIFDCTEMAVVKGVVMQQTENHFLPAAAGVGDYKKASSYFYTPSAVSGPHFGKDNQSLQHAFILTPAGNIIEATQPENAYRKSVNANSPEDFLLRHKPLVTGNGTVYGGYDDTTAGQQKARLAAVDAHVTPVAAAAKNAEIKNMQQHLADTGLHKDKPNGTWDEKTNRSLETLIVHAQMSRDYARAGGTIDGVYGPKTQQALDAMASRREIDPRMARELKAFHDSGQLQQFYQPQDVAGAIRAARQAPVAAAQPVATNMPQTSPRQTAMSLKA